MIVSLYIIWDYFKIVFLLMFDQHIVLCLQRHVDIGTTLLSFVGMHRITIILTHWQVCKGKDKGSFYIAQYPVHWTAQSALNTLF